MSGDIASLKRVREIMGQNFFGIEEAIKHFGVSPTKQQLAVLTEVPFIEGVLEECKTTHVLVAVFPLSILDIRAKVERQLFYSHDVAWYNQEKFAKERGEVSWQLARKTPVENSTAKTWAEQQTVLPQNEGVSSARVMVYTIIGHYLATGERLFERIYVRCSDMISDGYRVRVGDFGSRGLDVGGDWDDDGDAYIGLASTRKFD